LKTVPRVCSTDAKLLMLEHYETQFRIYNHDAPPPQGMTSDFALVAMHPGEDTLSSSLMRERAEQFAHHKVGDYFNISWLDYLSLPVEQAAMIMEISAFERERDDKGAAEALKKLGDIK
jgi:hypothetical protein